MGFGYFVVKGGLSLSEHMDKIFKKTRATVFVIPLLVEYLLDLRWTEFNNVKYHMIIYEVACANCSPAVVLSIPSRL